MNSNMLHRPSYMSYFLEDINVLIYRARFFLPKPSDWELHLSQSVCMYPSEMGIYGDNVDCSTRSHIPSIGVVICLRPICFLEYTRSGCPGTHASLCGTITFAGTNQDVSCPFSSSSPFFSVYPSL